MRCLPTSTRARSRSRDPASRKVGSVPAPAHPQAFRDEPGGIGSRGVEKRAGDSGKNERGEVQQIRCDRHPARFARCEPVPANFT